MNGKQGKGGWSRGKVAVAVMTACLVAAAASVVLVVALSGNGDGGTEAVPAEQEELLQRYEQVKQEADQAVEQMQDLGSQQPAEDTESYEQELEEAYAAMNQLYRDLEEAALATEEAAEQVSETGEDYEELYEEMLAYYAYVEQMYEQAVGQIEYLQSVAPALDELQQLQGIVDKLDRLPSAGAQAGELSSQLIKVARGEGRATGSGVKPPDSLSSFSDSLSSVTGQAEALAQQLAQALSAGDQQAFDSYASQLAASVTSLEQQLASQVSSIVSGFSSQLSSLSAAVGNAIP